MQHAFPDHTRGKELFYVYIEYLACKAPGCSMALLSRQTGNISKFFLFEKVADPRSVMLNSIVLIAVTCDVGANC